MRCFGFFNLRFFVLCVIFVLKEENMLLYPFGNRFWSAMKLHREVQLQLAKIKTKHNKLQYRKNR